MFRELKPEDLFTAEDLDFTEQEKDEWRTYELSDGTTLRIKTVLVGVKRLKKFNPDGIPVYVVRTQNLVRAVNVPSKFKQKPKPVATPRI